VNRQRAAAGIVAHGMGKCESRFLHAAICAEPASRPASVEIIDADARFLEARRAEDVPAFHNSRWKARERARSARGPATERGISPDRGEEEPKQRKVVVMVRAPWPFTPFRQIGRMVSPAT